MILIAIPNFGDRVSPRIDCAESLKLITIDGKVIVKTETVKILVHNLLDRINYILRLNPDIIICDGISELFQEKLSAKNIKVIAWIHGSVDDIIRNFINGKIENNKKEKQN